MNLLVMAILVLQPVVEETTPVRMVASGVGADDVEWSVDGQVVATSADREPVRLWLEPGAHEVRAASDADGWVAIVRPDPPADGARAVEAWVARSEAATPPPTASILHPPMLGLVLAIVAGGAVVLHRDGRPEEGAGDALGAP